jgi:hypothetical protein
LTTVWRAWAIWTTAAAPTHWVGRPKPQQDAGPNLGRAKGLIGRGRPECKGQGPQRVAKGAQGASAVANQIGEYQGAMTRPKRSTGSDKSTAPSPLKGMGCCPGASPCDGMRWTNRKCLPGKPLKEGAALSLQSFRENFLLGEEAVDVPATPDKALLAC